MSENKFTPGPWEVVQNSRRLEIRPVDGGEHRSAIAHIYRSGVYNANKYRMPSYANANLIASAPEMFEALEDVADYLSDMDFDEDTEGYKVVQHIEAAIKKARGQDA